MSVERKLAAIMFTDIAGYTESMSKSESKTLDLLDKKRNILNSLLKEHKGTFVKEIGDGTLTYFESAVNAATCAVKLQELTYDDKDMNIRAGIHIGDIVFKDGDVFGDGVNVASRLESIAPSGGVCVSKNVYDELINQDDFDGIELGLQSLKGVGRLVEVFGLKGEKLNEPNPDEYQTNKIEKHSDGEVPSIAIIPFRNKGKEEDAFYAYGISLDLISDCSNAGIIRVESLETVEELIDLSFQEKIEELNVRYIVTGSLWRLDNMFQLSIEVYDTKESRIIWSDRWQEIWENLSILKQTLFDGILKTLSFESKQIKINNNEAYEIYLKVKFKTLIKPKDYKEAENLLNKAISLDDNLLEAKYLLVRIYQQQIAIISYANESLSLIKKKIKLILDAILEKEKGNNSKEGLGKIYLYFSRFSFISAKYNEAIDFGHKSAKAYKVYDALKGQSDAYIMIGNTYGMKLNEYKESVIYLKKSIEVLKKSEDFNAIAMSYMNISGAYCDSNDYKSALQSIDNAFKFNKINKDKTQYSNNFTIIRMQGFIYLGMGDFKTALKLLNKALFLAEKENENKQKNFHYIRPSLESVATLKYLIGDYSNALLDYNQLLNMYKQEENQQQHWRAMIKIAMIHKNMYNFNKARDCFQKSLDSFLLTQKEAFDKAKGTIAPSVTALFIKVNLHIIDIQLKKPSNTSQINKYHLELKEEIKTLQKDFFHWNDYLVNEFFFNLYEFFKKREYIKEAYNKTLDYSNDMELKFKNDYLDLPIPKTIIKEYNKAFKK